jgi:hypothetical protein
MSRPVRNPQERAAPLRSAGPAAQGAAGPAGGDANPPEHIRYAEWLRWSGWLGLAALGAAFFIYVAGVVPPAIALDELPRLWRLPSRELLALHGVEGGWHWVLALNRSDMLNLLGIAILSTCSVFPLLAVTGIYRRRGDQLFALLCVLQAAVLVLAASGLLAAGH